MKTKFYKIIGIQMGLTAFIASILFLSSGFDDALSASIGGMIAILPNYLFFIRLFPNTSSADTFIKMFYLNEIVKLVLTIALFILAFGVLKAQFGPLFGTYILMLTTYWIGLAYLGKSPQYG